MKKIIVLLLTISLFTSCENEPIDTDFSEIEMPTDSTIPGSDSSNLSLSLYELDTDISFSFFGTPFQTIANSDITITNDIVTSSSIEFSVQGSTPETENQTITRNASGQIISDISTTTSGNVTNEYHITYLNNNISQITYNFYDQEDSSFNENYTYNFNFNGNTITRTKVDSSIETVFTLDASNKIVKKESFDSSLSIKKEELTYNSDGNVTNSELTGENESTLGFSYDTFQNPLKVVYDEQYLLSFLSDDYEDEIGSQIAHFHATKNWNSTTINGEEFNFDLQYNAANRISTRDSSYNYEGELSYEINERFNYIN